MTEEQDKSPSPALGPPVMVLVHALTWAPFLLCMFLFVPKMKALFADHAAKLPLATEMVLAWSDFLVEIGPLWLLGLLVWLGIDWVVLYNLHLARRNALIWIWFGVLALVPVILALASWVIIWAAADEMLLRIAA